MKYFSSLLFLLLIAGCTSENSRENSVQGVQTTDEPVIYLGADLSYVNEMLDCGGEFKKEGKIIDPYRLFADEETNLVRLRLWHSPEWTDYSNYADVKKAIKRSKALGMRILLDFHYSDDWADPGKQLIPNAWKDIASMNMLGDSVYNYTYGVLLDLDAAGLLPEMVQIGNETNAEVMMADFAENYDSINWERNVYLLNRGIKAVNDVSERVGKNVMTMLHIAQPENAEWWFPLAFDNGISDFDWVGLSYYPKWSKYSLSELSSVIESLRSEYGKRIMVVETAYPYTLDNADPANNLLGQDALIDGFDASPAGQRDYMIQLTKTVLQGGGEGVIYWEPAWISTGCSTRWGDGSHWDNATFFDFQNDNEALPVFDFFDVTLYSE